MTGAQWRVLTILLLTAGIEALFSPAIGTAVKNASTGNYALGPIDPSKPLADQLAAPAISAIGFTLGVLLLLWLAAGVPNLATAIALAILALVILRYGDQVVQFTSPPQPQGGHT